MVESHVEVDDVPIDEGSRIRNPLIVQKKKKSSFQS